MSWGHFFNIFWRVRAARAHLFDIFCGNPPKWPKDVFLTFWTVFRISGLTAASDITDLPWHLPIQTEFDHVSTHVETYPQALRSPPQPWGNDSKEQTNKQTNKQANKQTNKLTTNKHTDKQTSKQTNKQINKQYMYIHVYDNVHKLMPKSVWKIQPTTIKVCFRHVQLVLPQTLSLQWNINED